MNRSVSRRLKIFGPPFSGQPLLWPGIVIAGASLPALMLSCLTPFEAVAVLAGGTMKRMHALAVVMFVWLLDQTRVFATLGCPPTSDTYIWGGIMLAVAIANVLVISKLVNPTSSSSDFLTRSNLVSIGLAFLAATGIEQASYAAAARVLHESAITNVSILGSIVVSSAVWLAAMVAGRALTMSAFRKNDSVSETRQSSALL